jgi:drug/metabolite transporter (DMT)-like permease
MRLKADITLFIISIIWGSAFVAQRIAGQLGGIYLFNGARYLLAGLVVLPFALRAVRTSQSEPRLTPSTPGLPRDQYKWMLIAGFLLFVAAAFQQAGMLYTTAGNAGFITSLYVVLVPFVVLLGWKEKPHCLSVLAVVLAVMGAYLLSMGGPPALSAVEGFQVQKGDALELVGALFWALHVVTLGKFVSKFEPMSFSVGQLLVCGIFNLILGLFMETPIFTWPLAGAVVYTAVMSLGLCYTLQVWAQRHTPPSDAALLLSLESVFAVLAGWLFLDERLVGLQYAGCVLIFIAVALSQVKEWTQRSTMDMDHLVEGR